MPDETLSSEADSHRPAEGVRLFREVGRGAMGVVYAGWHISLAQPVAVKFLSHPEEATPERLARFRREAELCRELDEPALVRVFDFHFGQRPYLVMEWVPGRGLDLVIREAGPLSEPEVLTVLRDVGQALLGLHRKGVIHRDIKPSNLLLRAHDGRIKIADLGIAKQYGRTDSVQTYALLGTPAFINPEQVVNSAGVGPAGDLFSLGSTAFALLTGRPPFEGSTIWETMEQVRTRPLPHPRELGVETSDLLWHVLDRLTRKDLSERLTGAEQLLELLPAASVPFRPEVLRAAQPGWQVPPAEVADLIVPSPGRATRGGGAPQSTLAESTVQHRVPVSLLFCQCLQNDFLAPLAPGQAPPNKLHVGRDEALRLAGPDPRVGPLVRAVSACARSDNVRLIHIRDWHDPNDPRQQPELRFFGEHCLMGTWGARFIDEVEAFSRDRRRAAVVDSTGINDFEDTPVQTTLAALLGDEDRATVPVGVIGVWTNVKVHYLLYDLKTRARLHNLATCSKLVASPDRAAHLATLRHLEDVLNVRVFHDADAFLAFLGVQTVSPADATFVRPE